MAAAIAHTRHHLAGPQQQQQQQQLSFVFNSNNNIVQTESRFPRRAASLSNGASASGSRPQLFPFAARSWFWCNLSQLAAVYVVLLALSTAIVVDFLSANIILIRLLRARRKSAQLAPSNIGFPSSRARSVLTDKQCFDRANHCAYQIATNKLQRSPSDTSFARRPSKRETLYPPLRYNVHAALGSALMISPIGFPCQPRSDSHLLRPTTTQRLFCSRLMEPVSTRFESNRKSRSQRAIVALRRRLFPDTA